MRQLHHLEEGCGVLPPRKFCSEVEVGVRGEMLYERGRLAPRARNAYLRGPHAHSPEIENCGGLVLAYETDET